MMAETSAKNKRRVFWTNTGMDSSTDDSDAYVPGLSRPGNLRPKVKGRRTPEVKANISIDRPVEEELPGRNILVHDLSQSLDTQTQKRHTRKASFKDLRIEDKKRVANLIKELAKAGDEKERVVSQLHEERNQYEQQILQLVSQQEEVLREREDIQLKLFETQQMLTKFHEDNRREEWEKKNKVIDKECNFSPRPWRPEAPSKQQDEIRHHSSPREGYQPPQRPVPEFYDQNPIDLQLKSTEIHRDSQRTYTEYIDNEIAQQRKHERRRNEYEQNDGHIQHQRVGEHVVNGHINGVQSGNLKNRKHLGPLREPIMSSTQKSSQIIEEMSFNSLPTITSEKFQPIPLDMSTRTSLGADRRGSEHLRDRRGSDDKQRNRVGFIENVEKFDSPRVHSPVLENNQDVVGDRQFLEYYKKLTPAQRKKELLRQRSALLDEQNRLKQILLDQETQLREKQDLLNQRHRQKLEEYEELKVRVVTQDVPANGGMRSEKRVHADNKKTVSDNNGSIEDIARKLDLSVSSFSRSNSDASSHRDKVPHLKSAATSPVAFPTRTSVGTSPVRLDGSLLRDKENMPDLIDAGTSVSYAHLTRSPQQGNLPVPVNRQRTSPSRISALSPGDKTLAILDIVNSLDRLSDSLCGSSNANNSHNSAPMSTSSRSRDQSLSGSRDQSLSGKEDLEESRILEEVFFLK